MCKKVTKKWKFFGGELIDNVQSPCDLCRGDEEEGRRKTRLCSKESLQLPGGCNRGEAFVGQFLKERGDSLPNTELKKVEGQVL